MAKTAKDFKAGYAAIIGLPNAGKSTLLNALLDIKLSITSAKPQTTRRRILGILNKEKYQVIFIDTPGILKPKYELQKKMMQQVQSALEDADLLLLIVDATHSKHPVDLDLHKINPEHKPTILLLNKIDLLEKKKLLNQMDLYQRFYPFQVLIPISALQADGLDRVEMEIVRLLPQSPAYYPADILSEQPERLFVAEIIREKIFDKFQEEIPYASTVIIEDFKERTKGKDYIYAVIFVERKSQKGIIIGQSGEALRSIGASARQEIEELLKRKIYLELRVKVSANWRRDTNKLKSLGY